MYKGHCSYFPDFCIYVELLFFIALLLKLLEFLQFSSATQYTSVLQFKSFSNVQPGNQGKRRHLQSREDLGREVENHPESAAFL